MDKIDLYQITSLAEPFFLHSRHLKYWEIRYERAIKEYMNKQINLKIRKGYKFVRDTRSRLPTQNVSEESTSMTSHPKISAPNNCGIEVREANTLTSILGKRIHENNDNESLPGSQGRKAFHSDPLIPIRPKSPLPNFSPHLFFPNIQSSGGMPFSERVSPARGPSANTKHSKGQSDHRRNPVKEEADAEEGMEEEKEEQSAIDSVDQLRAAFEKEVALLDPNNFPFGRPVFGTHGTITTPSKWESENPCGWYISEKLGGIRCLWNGLQMWSKHGTQYQIPDFFVKRLPQSPLDGELYMGREKLSKCMEIVKTRVSDPDYINDWECMQFIVYDAPEASGNFRQRLQALQNYFAASDGLYVRLHQYRICEGSEDAIRELKLIGNVWGEGITLRDGNSPYTKGRSKFVLERKSHFEGRAEVIEHLRGKSKKGSPIVPSLRVRTAEGKEFLINRGITDDIRQHPPAVNTQILYKFSGRLDSGKPKAPIFLGVADDINIMRTL